MILSTIVLITAGLAMPVPAAMGLQQQPKGYLTPASQRALGITETPASGARTEPPAKVRFGANGWPILDPGAERGATAGRAVSDFDRQVAVEPSQPSPWGEMAPVPEAGGEVQAPPSNGMAWPAPAAAAGRGAGSSAGASAAPARGMPLPPRMDDVAVTASDSPLAAVFDVVGSPVRAHALAGVRATVRMEVFDERGAVVGGARELIHEADFGSASLDRLQLPGSLTFGRTEHGSYAERAGLPWPALDAAAGESLDIHGSLLRFPWGFADSRSYAVFPARAVSEDGIDFVVIRLERDRRGGGAMGPTAGGTVDRFELWCDPATRLPRELRYTLGATGIARRVTMSDWRPVPGIGLQMPYHREVLDADGKLLMGLTLIRLEAGLDMPPAAFRPR